MLSTVSDGRASFELFATRRPGSHNFVATYDGDAYNKPAATTCGSARVDVVKHRPALSAQARLQKSRDGKAAISDTVAITGGFGPTGTVAFSVFGPNDSECRRAPAQTIVVPVVGGGATLPALGASAGRYEFVASYSGDEANEPAGLNCGVTSITVPAPGSPKVRITKVTPGKGKVSVGIACDGDSERSCLTRVRLTARQSTRRGRVVSVTKAGGRVVVVGTKALTVSGGKRRTTTVKLNPAGRRLARRFARVPLTVSAKRGSQQTTRRVNLLRAR